ncbi:Polyadenylate-binding protein, cytoplasmic and nuclear [Venturia inaequalis]|nr:Polyadenylate-binding protein, cytoplasmic and nuclear [Venturia inaequalis]
MGVPFEALLPYGIMLGMFAVTGGALAKLDHMKNVMERDRRLTGYLRGQSDKPIAPKGFELNNPWKVEKRII